MNKTKEFITVTIPKEAQILEEEDYKVTVHYSTIRFNDKGAWVNGLLGPLKETPQEIMNIIGNI